MTGIFLVYLIGINLFSFVLFGLDKRRAKRDEWRITERTLLLSAALGGSAGALAGMRIFHHKTRHRVFRYGIPAMLILQIAAGAALLWRVR
ncbi:MAG: DUF1294 domain-containing protein [Clostridia bacterium]|nr:DUF1294 domain-containing protein [Clostridia bacterium]